MHPPAPEIRRVTVGGTCPIGRLAWRVFAPLDAVINVAINAPIAWWLYGGRDEVSLTGPFGLPMMLLPMTFILATATTFFGIANAVRERRAGRASPPLAADAPWWWRAGGEALAVGVVAWLAAVGCRWLLAWYAPGVTVGPTAAVVVMAAIAGLLGYLLHGRAVTRGGR
jgi:hypothetical protein